MIGQDLLLTKLDSYSVDIFPKSNLLIGEKGCGKHSFVAHFCMNNDIDMLDISDYISHEFLLSLYTKPNQVSYIIDINKISEKSRYLNKENALLKFIEEPPINAFIFVLVEYDIQVLDTIRNRCIEWKFNPYTISELKSLRMFNDDRVYSILNTPGKLIKGGPEEYYLEGFDLCNKILDNIKKANISNTLSLDRHLSKYDLSVLLSIMRTILYNRCKGIWDKKNIDAYNLTLSCIRKSHVFNINKQSLFDNFILELKSIYD